MNFNTPDFIQDYLDHVRDDLGYVDLTKVNTDYNKAITEFDNTAIQKANMAKMWENVTKKSSRFDLVSEREGLVNQYKVKSALTAEPHIDDRKTFEDITKKHIKNEKLLNEVLYRNHDRQLSNRQEAFLTVMESRKGEHSPQKGDDKTLIGRPSSSMSARFNATIGYSQTTKNIEEDIDKPDIVDKTEKPSMSMSQRFNQTLGYSKLDEPSDLGESKETKNLDLGKDDPNDD